MIIKPSAFLNKRCQALDEPGSRGAIDDVVIEGHCQAKMFPVLKLIVDKHWLGLNPANRQGKRMAGEGDSPTRTGPEHANGCDQHCAIEPLYNRRHPLHNAIEKPADESRYPNVPTQPTTP
jgi:hypothetical protein